MAKRIGGSRKKSRHKLKKRIRERGKISLVRYYKTFDPGEKVCLRAEPSVQKGIYHFRFYGKVGKIESRQGRCYVVRIRDGGKDKLLTVHPVHLEKCRT